MRRQLFALVAAMLGAAGCDPNVYVGHEEAPLDAADAMAISPVPWEAHHEDGTTSEWLADGFGDTFSEGGASLGISSEQAHAGNYALEAIVADASDLALDQAVLSRRVSLESGTYSAWYYFPAPVTAGHWVIMKLSSQQTGDRFDIDVHSVEGQGMRLRLYEHDDIGWITEPAAIELPIATWVHVEADLVARPDSNGRLRVRQDGVQVLDTGLRSTLPDNRVHFLVGTASFSVEPIPARVFIDDVGIFPAPQ